MAYRIRREESLRHAIKRMARGEIDDAREALDRKRQQKRGRSEQIHEVRTALKKARALVRLVGPTSGGSSKRTDRSLRRVARRLSAIRDSEVLAATFDRIRRAAEIRLGPDLQETRKTIERLLRTRTCAVTTAERRRLAAVLRRARGAVARWIPVRNRWRELGPGLAEGYERCRLRMRAAYSEDSPSAFHAWRRATKTHRYHVQALESLWPAELQARRTGLESLGELLGEEHDLAILAETVHGKQACFTDEEDCRRFLAALERRQQELRAAARPLGERLFAEKPHAWTRRVHAYFRVFRHERCDSDSHDVRQSGRA